jgi:threonine dehydrogenase-like Zn-dependent dehydrogenase
VIAAERAGSERDLVTAVIERNGLSWDGSEPVYALARIPGAAPGARQRRAVVAVGSPANRHQMVDPSRAIDVPEEIDADAAVLLPFLAEALRAWDLLDLEIGSAAVVTQGSPWSGVLAAVARCYGGVPVLVGGARAEGDSTIDVSDADAVAKFAATLSAFPAVCGVELSGRAEAVDLLLEAAPPYAHVLFAGPRGDRLTIDYYVNVHRKGMHLKSTVLSPARVLTADRADRQLTERACRLLSNARHAAAFREAAAQGRAAPSKR